MASKAAHVVIGVASTGSSRPWGSVNPADQGDEVMARVLTELRNRGCQNALFVCCGGLTGLARVNQRGLGLKSSSRAVCCIRCGTACAASNTDRKKMAKSLRPIYTAATEDAAKLALEGFRAEWKAKSRLRSRSGIGRGSNSCRSWRASRNPQGHLHHQRHRVARLPAAQRQQGPRLISLRRRRTEADVSGHPQHQPETRIKPRIRNLPL